MFILPVAGDATRSSLTSESECVAYAEQEIDALGLIAVYNVVLTMDDVVKLNIATQPFIYVVLGTEIHIYHRFGAHGHREWIQIEEIASSGEIIHRVNRPLGVDLAVNPQVNSPRRTVKHMVVRQCVQIAKCFVDTSPDVVETVE